METKTLDTQGVELCTEKENDALSDGTAGGTHGDDDNGDRPERGTQGHSSQGFASQRSSVDVNSVPIVEAAEALGCIIERVGSEVYIPCPVNHHEHDDCDAKCSLALDKPFWHCFKCGKSGDTVGLVKAVRGCESGEAYRWLRDTFHLDGARPPRPSGPVENLASLRGWNVEAMRRLGVTAKSGPVVFPMLDHEGNLVGEKLRSGDNKPLKTTSGAEAKSLTRPGGHNGLFYPRPFPENGTVLVVEGEADAVAALSAGHDAVVGTAGAQPGEVGRQSLQRLLHGRACVLCPHPDSAGETWLQTVGRLLRNVQCQVSFIPTEDDRDLDKRLRYAQDKGALLRELIKKALPWKDASDDERNLSQSELLTRICVAEIKEFIQDQFGACYVVIPVDEHLEVWSTSSQWFRHAWLARRFRERYGKPPGSQALRDAQGLVDGICLNHPRRELHNRVAWYDGKLYYDLTDSQWRGVEVTPEGWRVVPLPPIFRRHQHQLPQVEPVKGGTLADMWGFLNIPEADHRLFLTVLVSYFIPDIPHPIMILHGEQGSGKSVVGRLLRMLVDPSRVPTHALPKDLETLTQKLDHHWVCVFDNIGSLSEWLSDGLCRAITGEGFCKRMHYTNDEDFLRSYRRCVMLTSISNPAYRGDLLDRSILIETEAPNMVIDEKTLDSGWSKVLPGILGCIFDALSQAMKNLPNVSHENLPRMADFTVWGRAAAPALGFSAKEFTADYQMTIDQKWTDALESNPLASVIQKLLDAPGDSWVGTATEFCAAIATYNEDGKERLPASPNAGSHALTNVKPMLRREGIMIHHGRKGKDRKRVISIWRKAEKPDETEQVPF